MSKSVIAILVVLAAVLLAVPVTRASNHSSIVDIAVADDRFDTLAAAVVAAGLADELSGGIWTVFAPTDDAFARLGLNAGNIAGTFSERELVNILLYHALPADVSQEQAKVAQGDITMANGQRAGIKWFDGSLYVNDDARVIIPDVMASNGRIHAVDTVILGPWPRGSAVQEMAESSATTPAPASSTAAVAGNSIVDIAVADGRFKTLVAAVVAAGLADDLSGGTWTVFAPTDAAFARLGLNENNIAGAFSQAELVNILLYHALPANVSREAATAAQGDVVMANGQKAGIKWFDGSLYVNDDARVIIPDILADNGRIHVVDTVILGPWPRTGE